MSNGRACETRFYVTTCYELSVAFLFDINSRGGGCDICIVLRIKARAYRNFLGKHIMMAATCPMARTNPELGWRLEFEKAAAGRSQN
jgi:hypothetical protein